MRQTFEELVDFDHECNMMDAIIKVDYESIQEEIIKLLVYVREQTLKECAKVCNELQDTSTFSGWIDESLFLDLDKDSIEI